jgi:putative ABC transport system substrate-binding protein
MRRILSKLSPDLLVANATSALAAAQEATQTIPIVFVQVTDPVRGGFVATLARPGGNITGFTSFEDTMGAKWLELLKQIAPQTSRALIVHNAAADTGTVKLMPAIRTTAQSLGIELLYIRDGPEIEKAFQMVANASGAGVIPVPDALFTLNRKRLITLAAEQRLPAVYYFRYFAADGGLMSYGPDTIEVYRQAAAYIDRILKGANPGELPVQNPTKYELVLNLKTAKTLGLTVPPQLQALADEVIE